MATAIEGHISVGTLDQVREWGCYVITAGGYTQAEFYHVGKCIDDRCPHIGFSVDRGSIQDGILTCHRHHIRFDVPSGDSFNLFVDDVLTFHI